MMSHLILPERSYRRVARLFLKTLKRVADWRMRAPVDNERQLAWLELQHCLDVVWFFGPGNLRNIEFDAHFPLSERVSRLMPMGSFNSIWALEGLGFSFAESAWKRNQPPPKRLADRALEALPTVGIAAFHIGVAQAVAISLLKANDGRRPAPLHSLLERFLDVCERTGPEAGSGIALEGLGFVVRNLYPEQLLGIDAELQKMDDNLLPFFWHGVGRALYFTIPRALCSGWFALEEARRVSPHKVGRLNVLSGLSFPLTLVNIRQPAILEAVLNHYSPNPVDDDAFSHGVACAALLWRDWAGSDSGLNLFGSYRADGSIPEVGALWNRLVKPPFDEVLRSPGSRLHHIEWVRELFRYQPLSTLWERLPRQPHPGSDSG